MGGIFAGMGGVSDNLVSSNPRSMIVVVVAVVVVDLYYLNTIVVVLS